MPRKESFVKFSPTKHLGYLPLILQTEIQTLGEGDRGRGRQRSQTNRQTEGMHEAVELKLRQKRKGLWGIC